jgi:hypothetical protein
MYLVKVLRLTRTLESLHGEASLKDFTESQRITYQPKVDMNPNNRELDRTKKILLTAQNDSFDDC